MKRILALDGGGIKGVFTASFLTEVEDKIGDRIGNYFDLIVGTSTGGIIAIGIGLGIPAKDILSIYQDMGSKIFPRSLPIIGWVRDDVSSRYRAEPLREALELVFNERRLGESRNRLVIPAFNSDRGQVHVYKTAHHKRFVTDYNEKVIDVALATAAAPTFFPPHRHKTGTPLIDGGVWANNPAGAAIVEGIGVLGWDPEEIKLLSIGNTSSALNLKFGRFREGWGVWARNIVSVFMAGQSSGSLGTASLLIGAENLLRIDPTVAHGKYSIDGVSGIKSLIGLGHAEAREFFPKINEIFLGTKAEEFIPYYKLPQQ